jgi:hypothetical protein
MTEKNRDESLKEYLDLLITGLEGKEGPESSSEHSVAEAGGCRQDVQMPKSQNLQCEWMY